jgi:uncharacterized protein YqgC (DUF456 family)
MTALDVALWVVAVALIVIGLAGIILPAVPGIALIFGGIALAAWIDGFTRIPGWTVLVLGVLTAIAFVADYLSSVLGARRAGASRLAVVGAAIGVVAGIFAGLIGVVIFPFIGAVVGQFVGQRDLRNAGKVGVATWIGLAIGTAVKVAIAFTMVGVFIVALLW